MLKSQFKNSYKTKKLVMHIACLACCQLDFSELIKWSSMALASALAFLYPQGPKGLKMVDALASPLLNST